MHGEELDYIKETYHSKWRSTVGNNINEAEHLYGMPRAGISTLSGYKVFCSDMIFDVTVNPIAYESGEAVFIDIEYDTWNMSPETLE